MRRFRGLMFVEIVVVLGVLSIVAVSLMVANQRSLSQAEQSRVVSVLSAVAVAQINNFGETGSFVTEPTNFGAVDGIGLVMGPVVEPDTVGMFFGEQGRLGLVMLSESGVCFGQNVVVEHGVVGPVERLGSEVLCDPQSIPF